MSAVAGAGTEVGEVLGVDAGAGACTGGGSECRCVCTCVQKLPKKDSFSPLDFVRKK